MIRRCLRAFACYLIFGAGVRAGTHQEDMACYLLLFALVVLLCARRMEYHDTI